MSNNLQWTKPDVERLRCDYDKAVEQGKEEFKFVDGDGNLRDVLTDYAKYLLEYLEPKFDV